MRKAFIPADLEDTPFTATGEHPPVKGALHSEARKTVAAAECLHENGFDEVAVADGHGPMFVVAAPTSARTRCRGGRYGDT